MVFNSYQFILGFLPVAYVGFLLAHAIGGRGAALRFLAVASLAFYGLWSLELLAILLVSVVANYAAGNLIMRFAADRHRAGWLLVGAIAANLLALGYFKYTNFLLDIANQLTGAGFNHINLFVPIGVSFYTFIQIGYLVEAYNGQVDRPDFGRYLLFATFLPCVTAGPLVLQREMLDQMRDSRVPAYDARRLAVGLTMFGMGLFKKIVLADAIAPYADTVFDGVAAGQLVVPLSAWLGALCYALQLYFDFSGYSDMAIGLGFIFAIRLPLNFNSPFKATSISDFWRRWHMTMTRFFTNFIYTPLAMRGMRAALRGGTGRLRRVLLAAAMPAVVTFVVAGLWHGAGWNFVVYGLILGVAIAVNSTWREMEMPKLPAPVGWALTMAVVVSGLVVFRAPDLATSGTILANMWGICSLLAPPVGQTLVQLDVRTAASLVVVLGAIVLLLPNTQQILHRDWVSSDPRPTDIEIEAGLVVWRPNLGGSLVIGGATCIAVASIGAASTFLYYQF